MSKSKSIVIAISIVFAIVLGFSTRISFGSDSEGGRDKFNKGKDGAVLTDTLEDGNITKDEWNKYYNAKFEKMDINKDGIVDRDELSKMKDEKRKMQDNNKGD